MHFISLTTVLSLALSALSSPAPYPLDLAPSSKTTSSPLPVTTVYQFEPGKWAEALEFRPCGQLVVNILSSPEIYQIDPVAGTAVLVATNPNITAFYGIAQVAPDQFYFAGGNITLKTSTKPLGTYSVFHIDMSKFDASSPGSANLEKVADFPLATLNGMFTLDAEKGLVLVGDATNGVIYTLNVYTGENAITIDDPLLKTPPNATTKLNVNGIVVRPKDSAVYFTNTAAGAYGKIPINLEDGKQTGPGVLLATNPEKRGGDDLTLDAAGNAFVAEDPLDFVSLIRKDSSTPEIIAGGADDTETIPGPTAAKFGTSKEDVERGGLYVTFNGGIAQYTSGNFTNGGGVLRLDTGSLEGCH
ncbi:MAG: hypothetical protein Q9160_008024 [Pyrenula sp. 1 TL-2023]